MEFELRPVHDLGPADTVGHDERLTRWMRMPRRARARLEMHDGAADAQRIGSLKLSGDGDLPGEIFGGSIDRLHVSFAHSPDLV